MNDRKTKTAAIVGRRLEARRLIEEVAVLIVVSSSSTLLVLNFGDFQRFSSPAKPPSRRRVLLIQWYQYLAMRTCIFNTDCNLFFSCNLRNLSFSVLWRNFSLSSTLEVCPPKFILFLLDEPSENCIAGNCCATSSWQRRNKKSSWKVFRRSVRKKHTEGGKEDGGAKCTPVVAESISSVLFDLVWFLFEKGYHSMKVLEVWLNDIGQVLQPLLLLIQVLRVARRQNKTIVDRRVGTL